MRRLLIALAALAAAPAAASAQNPPSLDDLLTPADLPDIPAAGTPRKPRSATFKVSLYGVQRYSLTSVEEPLDTETCSDRYGTTVSRTVVRFHSERPRRARVTFYGGRLAGLQWLGRADDTELPVRASFAHSGEVDGQVKACNALDLGWQPVQPPPARNCSETHGGGFDIGLTGSRIKASYQPSLVTPIAPFEGCPWGNLSVDLYGAERAFAARRLLDEDETQLVLRASSTTPSQGPKGHSETRKRTTIYVTFKRVRR